MLLRSEKLQRPGFRWRRRSGVSDRASPRLPVSLPRPGAAFEVGSQVDRARPPDAQALRLPVPLAGLQAGRGPLRADLLADRAGAARAPQRRTSAASPRTGAARDRDRLGRALRVELRGERGGAPPARRRRLRAADGGPGRGGRRAQVGSGSGVDFGEPALDVELPTPLADARAVGSVPLGPAACTARGSNRTAVRARPGVDRPGPDSRISSRRVLGEVGCFGKEGGGGIAEGFRWRP